MSYIMALVTLGLKFMDVRRDRLCKNFAKKTFKSRHADIFQLKPSQYLTHKKAQFVSTSSNTKIFCDYPLNFLTMLLKIKEETPNFANLPCKYWTIDVQLCQVPCPLFCLHLVDIRLFCSPFYQ